MLRKRPLRSLDLINIDYWRYAISVQPRRDGKSFQFPLTVPKLPL
jgi:hypothetical protein